MEHNIYKRHGYDSREEYLESLADDFGIDPERVYMMADILGESEDFDALVTELEDMYE